MNSTKAVKIVCGVFLIAVGLALIVYNNHVESWVKNKLDPRGIAPFMESHQK
jgi:uncharacterized membrane protein HdeD (DUF308 family)